MISWFQALAFKRNLYRYVEALSKEWAEADDRFKKLEPFLPGCRMLRQDPAVGRCKLNSVDP